MQLTTLITGATGFLGAYTALEFLRAGYNVKGTYRSTSSIKKAKHIFCYHPDGLKLFDSIEWVNVDLEDYNEVKKAFQNVDFVVHTAAEVSFNKRRKNQIIENNTRMAAYVVDAALETGVKKLCHISSIAALGSTTNGDLINEETKFSSVKEQSGYSISKFYSEMEVWRGINSGLNAVILNPSVIFGAGDWKSSSSTFVATAGKGTPFYTLGVTGFVDVKDVAHVCRLTLESELSGERYLLSAENINYQELFNSMADELGKKRPSIKATPALMKVVACACMGTSLLTGKEPQITFSIARSAWSKMYYDGSKIEKLLNFKYTPISETIRFACDCYKKDNLTKK